MNVYHWLIYGILMSIVETNRVFTAADISKHLLNGENRTSIRSAQKNIR
jgi:hypothetical protein